MIFGTGESARKVLKSIKHDNTEIIAFADNNYNKHGKTMQDIIIINPKEIGKLKFDYIIISNIKYTSIREQLIGYGIHRDKIFSYFDEKALECENYKEIVDICVVLRDIYDYKIQQLLIKITNMPYELANQKLEKVIEVKNIEDTMQHLLESNDSISRFGDGEMKLIAGKDIGFQKYSEKLKLRLQEVLTSNIENHIVGILNVFGDLSIYTEEIQTYFRNYLYEYNREFQFSVMDTNKIYYDAFITRPYISYKNREHAKKIFYQFKLLWDQKSVLIVEGDRTRLGIGNDLFENAREIKRIICPNENAFEYYDKILEKIKMHCKNSLVLLALGPTATVLAYDLAKEGIRTLDIGHIDLEYEWYLMGAKEKVIVKNKYTNEVFGGNEESIIVNDRYDREIVERISA